MRSVAAAGFIALGFGCNALLGLDETHPELDAPPSRMHLLVTQQNLTAPDVIETPPLAGLDKVKLAPMAMAFDDRACADNPPPCTQSFDGTGFVIPGSLAGQLYRLLYQPVGDPIPHEIQWSFGEAHLAMPFFGKPGQPPAPQNATVNITVPGHGGFDTPLVFSYGTNWSAGGFTQTNPGNPANYDFTANAKAVDGTLATLQSGTDIEVMVDFTGNVATGGARFNVDLEADTVKPVVTEPWVMPPSTTLQFQAPVNSLYFDRLVSALGGIAGAKVSNPMIYAGVLPSEKMPPLAIQPFQPVLDPLAIPMFALAQAPANASSMTFVNPFASPDPLPVAIAYQATQKRTDGTLTLYHSFQWIRLASQVGSTVALDSGQVGIPTMPKLAGMLLTENDNKVVPLAGAPTVTLGFGLDQSTQDCITTLYQVNGATLNALRTYQVIVPATTSASIQIESSIFQVGPKYVFGIVCRSGGDVPNDVTAGFFAARTTGDYSQVGYPFSISTVFLSTFTVVP
jgi:hypothetical protein